MDPDGKARTTTESPFQVQRPPLQHVDDEIRLLVVVSGVTRATERSRRVSSHLPDHKMFTYSIPPSLLGEGLTAPPLPLRKEEKDGTCRYRTFGRDKEA